MPDSLYKLYYFEFDYNQSGFSEQYDTLYIMYINGREWHIGHMASAIRLFCVDDNI